MKISIKKNKIRFLFYILTAVVMGIIFYFSAQNSTQSQSTSGNLIQFLLNLFNIEPTAEKIRSLQGIVRTEAHFCAFGLLGFMFFCSYIFSGKSRHTFLIPLFCTICYAVIDETHQLFSEGRAFQFFDIFIDTFGGALFIFIGMFFFSLVLKRRGWVSRPEVSKDM